MTRRAIEFAAKLTAAYGSLADSDWKRDHDDAMRLRDFEDTLAAGVRAFECVLRVDEELRLLAADSDDVLPSEATGELRRVLRDWLKSGDHTERSLVEYERDYHDIASAGRFRQCVQEARWILAPAAEAFDHPRMVGLRDAAVDEHRCGLTEALDAE